MLGLRVATKYVNLTRSFFADNGIADYRIVESAGATEGAPAAGSAELIVDITTTGSTLQANNLKILADGATRAQAMLKVVLPLAIPGVVAVGLYMFITSWNEYLFANLFVGTDVRTFTIVIPTFTHGSQTLWNLQMAFSLIAMLPPVILFVVLRRYMVRGLSLGVVKG